MVKTQNLENQELASYMLVELITHGYIEQRVSLYYFSRNAQTLSVSMFIVGIMAEAKVKIMKDS